MTIRDELEQLSLRLGYRVVLPTPPACQHLLDQAKASGIPLGTLFVLSHPLFPEIRGSYDRESGDLWCHYDGADEKGAHEVLQCLLTLIAYAKLHLPVPTTIQEDWEQAEHAHREAFALAQAWNRSDLFSAAELESLLAHDQYLLRCHLAAGELAGHLAPSVARNAYLALLEVRQRYQWNDAQFEAALSGVCEEDEEANAAVLDFDRTVLRPRWLRWNLRGGDALHDASGASLLPQTPGTAEVLREALRKAASGLKGQTRHRRLWPISEQVSLAFFLVEREEALSSLIAQVSRWLIEEYPLRYVRVWWCLYADGEPETARSAWHLYQLHIEYVPCHPEGTGRSEPFHSELWALFPVRRKTRLEAAWQRYLHSWSAFAHVSGESLSRGLHTLWSQLEGGACSRDD